MSFDYDDRLFTRDYRFTTASDAEDGDLITQAQHDVALDGLVAGFNASILVAVTYDSKSIMLASTDSTYVRFPQGRILSAGPQLFEVAAATASGALIESCAGGLRVKEAGANFTTTVRAQAGNTLGATYITVDGVAFIKDAAGTALTTGDAVTWRNLVSLEFKSETEFLADTLLSYSNPGTSVSAGDILTTRTEHFSYAVAVEGATDYDKITAGLVKAYMLTVPVAQTFTIGAGKDYETINAALAGLSDRRPLYMSPQITTTLELATGFVMDEQVLADGVDLGWLSITSIDASVVITGSSMEPNLLAVDGSSVRYAFGADNGGVLPRINALFAVDGSGTLTKRHGLVLVTGSRGYVGPGCGIRTAPNNGVTMDGNSFLFANTSNFSNSGGYGAYLYGGSTLVADYANFSYAGDDGVIATRNSRANLSSADVSNAGVNGVLATQGSVVVAGEINADDCASSGLRARGASVVNANSCSAQRCSTGIYADRDSRFSITDDTVPANFTGCTSYAIRALNGGTVSGKNIICDTGRVFAENGGVINAPGVSIANTASGFVAVRANTGGRVNVDGGVISSTGSTGKAMTALGGAIWANNSTISSSLSTPVVSESGSEIYCSNSTINTVTSAAVFLLGGNVCASECTFNAVDQLIFDSLHGGKLDAGSATINWSGTPPGTAFRVKDGAVFNLSGTTETANVTVNTVSASGIVIQ